MSQRRHPVIAPEEVKRLFDYDQLTGELTWKVSPARVIKPGQRAGFQLHNSTRVSVHIKGRLYPRSRVAWCHVHGEWPRQFIDHINGDPSDDRIENLRDVSPAINTQNIRKAHKSNVATGLLGVTVGRNGTYKAKILVAGKRVSLGTFKTPQEAHDAYLTAKRELHPGCTI